MSKEEDDLRDALADLILRHEPADLKRFMPKEKPSPWRPNKAQMIFGWVVGVLALMFAVGQVDKYDGNPLAPSIIGIIAIAWALGYRRQ